MLRADLYRNTGRYGWRAGVLGAVKSPGVRYVLLWRVCNHLRRNRLARRTIYLPLALVLHRWSAVYGIQIPPAAQIGPGLFLGHFMGIVVSSKATLGKNCNLSNGVTIGRINRGKRQGYPTLGDNVFVGPNACVLGNLRIGNNVAIGAGAIVIDDVPDNSVVAGNPGKVVSQGGSEGYVNLTDWE